MKLHCFLSCEHGGNHIPEEYAHLFSGAEHILSSHRGWDKGTLSLFEVFKTCDCFHHAQHSTVSRLLIDLNRSVTSRNLFSAYTIPLAREDKNRILTSYYLPYRNDFMQAVNDSVDSGRQVLHISLHSFTPVLNGTVRNGDIGILYDPAHGREREFATIWMQVIRRDLPELKVRANYPYRGKADGHPLPLRKLFGNDYLGIELEVNHNIIDNADLHTALISTFVIGLNSFQVSVPYARVRMTS